MHSSGGKISVFVYCTEAMAMEDYWTELGSASDLSYKTMYANIIAFDCSSCAAPYSHLYLVFARLTSADPGTCLRPILSWQSETLSSAEARWPTGSCSPFLPPHQWCGGAGSNLTFLLQPAGSPGRMRRGEVSSLGASTVHIGVLPSPRGKGPPLSSARVFCRDN